MEILDQTYLNDLVIRSERGDSNAFSELFAAVWEGQYVYLSEMLEDRAEIETALREVFSQALQRLPGLPRAELFLPWLCRISFLYCRERQEVIPGEGQGEQQLFHLSRILNLPLTESQILLMTYVQNLPDEEIRQILNLSRILLRRYRKDGLRHLQRDMTPGEQAGGRKAALPADGSGRKRTGVSDRRRAATKPGAGEVTKILEYVFDSCGRKPNTVPMEALASYAVYRRERFFLQKGILSAGLIAFLFLPMLFLMPKFEVRENAEGERGLPVYTIEVQSFLPVEKVLARLNTHSLPVYEAGAKEFTVEPTRNGTMTVYVELINRQQANQTVSVQSVDAKGPELISSETGSGTVLLKVADAGIGADYRESYAVTASGTVIRPLEINEQTGEILFAYPEEDWDVYIPDHIGNTLHLAITLNG